MSSHSLRCTVLVGLLVLGSCKVRQPGDVRLEALDVLERAAAIDQALSLADLVEDGLQDPSVLEADLPSTIRVWRRQKGNGGSCQGRVEELPLEEYVSGVLPHEWVASWEPEALDAGAIAIRTYASFWSLVGGKYECADLDDTTWSQVYDDDRHPNSDSAVDRTRAQVAVRDGGLIYAEYSAENTGMTAHGVEDEVCQGKALKGHGRGLCQWGSQRWAEQGKSAAWIVEHYYPGANLGDLETLRALDSLSARLRLWPDPIRIEQGRKRHISLVATNTSADVWESASVWVATVDGSPSRSYTADWRSTSEVATNVHPVAPGERVRFDVPLASGDHNRTERLGLFDAQGRMARQHWDLRIRRTAPRGSPMVWWGAVVGLSIALLALGWRRWRGR